MCWRLYIQIPVSWMVWSRNQEVQRYIIVSGIFRWKKLALSNSSSYSCKLLDSSDWTNKVLSTFQTSKMILLAEKVISRNISKFTRNHLDVEISEMSCHSDFTWNQFQSKPVILTILLAKNFDFVKIVQFLWLNFTKIKI